MNEATNPERTEPPKAVSILRRQIARARNRFDALRTGRQRLGVPVVKDRLHRREQLKAEMAAVELELALLCDALPLVEEEERHARREAERQERVRLTIELRATLDTLVRERDAKFVTLSDKTVPTTEELRDLRESGRACEDIRCVLLAATHEDQFAKPVDPVGQLDRVHRDQREQRDRSFALLRSPSAPRPALPRNARLTRLRELLASEQDSTDDRA